MKNKRYLDCKYLDAGMDGMLCSLDFCTTCREFLGDKCYDYTSKNTKQHEKTRKNMQKFSVEKQIDEIVKDIVSIQKQKRKEYCLRIQKAFEYKGTNDHEDIPSILKDYEDLIMNRYFIDSVVLSRELYNEMVDDVKVSKEKIARIIDCTKEETSKEMVEKIFEKIKNKINEIEKFYFDNGKIGYNGLTIRELNKIAEQFGIEIKE